MMAKMGYVKGQGLGKNNDGVTTHLEVKIRKPAPGGQASIFDDGEGNKVKSAQVWDVHGGERKKDEPGKFGEESAVVVAWGCVDGVDWGENAERDDGGIRQDMGEVFSTKVCLAQILHIKVGSDRNAVRPCRAAARGRIQRRRRDIHPLQVGFECSKRKLPIFSAVYFVSPLPTCNARLSTASTRVSSTGAEIFAPGITTSASSMQAYTSIENPPKWILFRVSW